MNKMSVAKLIPLNEYKEDEILLYGALASQEANHDSIDMAFLKAANQKQLLNSSYVQKTFTPFDPKIRMTEATVTNEKIEFQVMKGSFPIIALVCKLSDHEKKEIEIKIEEMAKNGYRVIAVAKALSNVKPEVVGLAALHDPPRSDSKKLIAELRKLGVSVKMLTGDALPIAKEIAKAVGIGDRIFKASDLEELAKTDPQKAAEMVESSDGFAEVYPEDKYLIVKSFQAKGHIVGMTGDGVNDAPALKQAEVGIAVSNANGCRQRSCQHCFNR